MRILTFVVIDADMIIATVFVGGAFFSGTRADCLLFSLQKLLHDAGLRNRNVMSCLGDHEPK